jgi:uncharacterized protein (DUF58 family)
VGLFQRAIYRNYRIFSGTKFRLERRVTRSGILVVCSLLLCGALGLDTTLSLAYQVFALLFSMTLLCAFYPLFCRVRLQVERSLPRFASAGEPFSYTVRIKNPRRNPERALTLREEFPDPRPFYRQFITTPEPGEERRNWYDRVNAWYRWQWLIEHNRKARSVDLDLPVLPSGEWTSVRASMVPLRRGALHLKGVLVFCPDWFGIFRAIVRVPAPGSVLILPKRYSMKPIEVPGYLKYQRGGISLASSVGESEEFLSLREYRPGDPLRRIHWKSFAKTGKPIVKEFQEEDFVRYALLLDTFSRRGADLIFEETVSIAASVVYTIEAQESLLDLMFVGAQAYCFTAGRGVGQTEQLLEILAGVQPSEDPNMEGLSKLVLRHVAELSGCVCAFLEWDEPRQELVRKLRESGVPVWVFVVAGDKIELDPGPLRDSPERFKVLVAGRIAESLATP